MFFAEKSDLQGSKCVEQASFIRIVRKCGIALIEVVVSGPALYPEILGHFVLRKYFDKHFWAFEGNGKYRIRFL